MSTMLAISIRPCYCLHLRRFISNNHYKDSFARKMAMAGIKPHHRIALGISGGADSTALCVLTAGWKSDGLGLGLEWSDGSGSIDGILGIVVDHKLRAESAEEAELVRDRVSKMGIRCMIKSCDWSGGKPKLGHLQEAARDMRYQIFQSVCIEQQIGVLLIAQHADDQAELAILRLSRNSGVLGLAGMAFMSQLFPTNSPYFLEGNQGILLVRPTLEFSKDDMYRICEWGHQQWVEDPTNQRPLFARNRLRMSLKNIPSNVFRSELQRFIAACRSTRSFIQKVCDRMIEHCVIIADHGYAIIDVEKLEPSNVEDLCLSKFLAIIVRFISQRHRPIRGSVSQLLLDYIRTSPCKTSLTAAGCYLSAAPRSKGTKILVCSHDLPQSSRTPLSHIFSCNKQPLLPGEIVDQIIMDSKSYSDPHVPEVSSVHFLHTKSSNDVLNEAKKLNIISESTFSSMCMLQMEERRNFISKPEGLTGHESRHEKTFSSSSHMTLCPGESCHFMSRFLVTWEVSRDALKEECCSPWKNFGQESEGGQDRLCQFCMGDHRNKIAIRHMVEADWLYLAKISTSPSLDIQDPTDTSIIKSKLREFQHSAYLQLSAKKALQALKSIPVSARRALPVCISSRDLLLSIPIIGFSCCPFLVVTAVFKPRVPLGGGYSSYI